MIIYEIDSASQFLRYENEAPLTKVKMVMEQEICHSHLLPNEIIWGRIFKNIFP